MTTGKRTRKKTTLVLLCTGQNNKMQINPAVEQYKTLNGQRVRGNSPAGETITKHRNNLLL